MSVTRLFTVIGDPNVRRNMTGLNMASRDSMKSAQVIACDNLLSLDQALFEVRAESTVCIISAITNMLLEADDTGTVASSIESVITNFKSKIIALCSLRTALQVVVAPPLFRIRPVWYQKNLPQISGLFSTVMSNDVPPNLHLLASFCSQDLLPDGIYLSPVSGLHFVLHLFDQTENILRLVSASSDEQIFHVRELCRHHDDRLVFLEKRHGILDVRVDLKVAADAEFKDWMLNRSEEDWFTIIGSKRFPSDLTPREWQLTAKKHINGILKLVLSANQVQLDYTILVVANPLRYAKQGQTVYNVRLSSVQASKHIRDLFSGFFRKDSPVKLPSSLRGISIRNKVTLETRVRFTILRQLGLNFQSSNGPGSSFKVSGYDSRPMLTTFPASKSERSRTYSFIDAVSQLPAVFSDEGLMRIHQVVGNRFQDELQALFVVLRDDGRARIEQLIRDRPRDRGQSQPSLPLAGPAMSFSGLGSGMDVQASLRLPPPPPPPNPPQSARPPPSKHRVAFSDRRSSSPSPRVGKEAETPARDREAAKSRRRRASSSSSEERHHHRSRKGRKKRRRSPSSSSGSSSSSSSTSDRSRKHGRER